MDLLFLLFSSIVDIYCPASLGDWWLTAKCFGEDDMGIL